MAIYEYTVEGIYTTDKGTGKEFTNFSFKIKLPRFGEKGAGTHILRRFLPMLIKQQKNKPVFSGIKHWVITDVQKVSDDFMIDGKEIMQMNEYELQQLACLYNLYEVPLPSTTALYEIREKAAKAFLKHVLKVPMKTPQEQKESGFYKQQPDGSLKFDLGDNKLTVLIKDIFAEKKAETKQKSLADYIKEAGFNVANTILNVTGNGGNEGNFPNANDLQNANAG